MKRQIYYIAYNVDTFKILFTSKWFDKIFMRYINGGDNDFINVTHPKSKDILDKINRINNTFYF